MPGQRRSYAYVSMAPLLCVCDRHRGVDDAHAAALDATTCTTAYEALLRRIESDRQQRPRQAELALSYLCRKYGSEQDRARRCAYGRDGCLPGADTTSPLEAEMRVIKGNTRSGSIGMVAAQFLRTANVRGNRCGRRTGAACGACADCSEAP